MVYNWVLIWVILSSAGITSGTQQFTSQETCVSAANSLTARWESRQRILNVTAECKRL